MKKYLLVILVLFSLHSNSQVGIGTNSPHVSSILDLTSTNKGLLPPRMTLEQRNAIQNPLAGLVVWCTNCGSVGEMQVYNGNAWKNVVGNNPSVPYLYSVLNTLPTASFALRKLRIDYNGPLVRINIGSSYYDVYPDNSINSAFSLSSPISNAYTSFDAATTGINGSNTLNSIITGSTTATVAIWYDQSGNNNNTIQAISSFQPRIISDGVIDVINGKPAIYSNQKILLSSSVPSLGGSNPPITFTGVVKVLVASAYGQWWATGTTASSFYGLDVSLNSNASRLYIGTNGQTNDTGPLFNTWIPHVVTAVYNGTQAIPYLNENLGSTLTFNVNGGAGNINIGGARGIVSSFNGYLPEVVVFNSVLSTAERQLIEHNQGAYFSITVN